MKKKHILFPALASAVLALNSAAPLSLFAQEEPMDDFVESTDEMAVSAYDEEYETELTESELEMDLVSHESAEEADWFSNHPQRTRMPELFAPDSSDVFEDLSREAYTLDVPAGTPTWKDDRKAITDTSKFPNSAICFLDLVFVDKKGEPAEFRGTGFFISPREILTCAHNLYDTNEGLGEVKQIDLAPGWNGKDKPTVISSAKEKVGIAYPKAFTTRKSPANYEYDWGVIKLNKDVAKNYIRLSTAGGQEQKVHLIGYPASAGNKLETYQQWEDWGTKSRVRSCVLETDVTGSGGQSGSPLLNSSNQAMGLFGFGIYKNTYGIKVNMQWGGGVAINSANYNAIDATFSGKNNIEAPVFRCYNPNSGEHVYTMNYNEVKHIVSVGWKDEGVAWRNSEGKDRIPVYRLYNPNAGDHHYTSDKNEYNHLTKVGWKGEGIMWYAPSKSQVYQQVYRAYNPNAKAGAHHFTTDKNEYNHLCKIGWKGENIAFPSR